jgi:hypothetical protein
MKDPNVEPWRPDWTSVSEAAVYQLLQEAKDHLQGTIELGINADQRSAALCGVFGAGAFALFAVSATVFAGDHRSDILQWAAVIEGFVLLIASLLCAWAAGPGDFYVSGYEPRLLIASAADTLWMQRYIIEDIQRRIEANRAEIIREALLMKTAIWVAVTGIILGLVIFAAGLVLVSHRVQTTHPSSAAGWVQGAAVVAGSPATRVAVFGQWP